MRVGLCLAANDYGSSWFSHDLVRMVIHTVRERPDIDLPLFPSSGSELPQVRHNTVASALMAGCDWLWFVDNDMRFPAHTLLAMLEREKPVVAVNYTARHLPFVPTAVAEDGSRVYTDEESTGLVEVGTVGMGVMLVQAPLLRLIDPPWFMIGWTGTHYSLEDSYFCRKLRAAGASIWLDQDLSQDITHMGVVEFHQSHAVRPKLVEVT